MTPELSESDAARFRAFERTRYHALAESYDNFFTPVTTNAIAPLLKAVRLKASDKLLDVACGSGALAATAREQGAQATGIDLTPGMIALRFPRSRGRASALSRGRIRRGGVQFRHRAFSLSRARRRGMRARAESRRRAGACVVG